MWEVDEALARVFPPRTQAGGPSRVPPPPHWPSRPDRAPDAETVSPAPFQVSWPAVVEMLTTTYAERFERLADALLAAKERLGVKVILFTSAQRAEGRTTLVLSAARALAKRPGRTLVVDGDLKSPALARRLGLPTRMGLVEVMDEGQALTNALIEVPGDGLTFLPIKGSAKNGRAFLTSPGWTRGVTRLRREFDLVLIDGGPIFQGLARPSLPNAIDAAVVVHNRLVSSPRMLLRARHALEDAGIPLLGLADTFVG